MTTPSVTLLSTLSCTAALALSLTALPAAAQKGPFMLSSPDLAMGTFDNQFVLNGFGCKGGNVSPALVWQNVPPGTKSLALQVFDPDAPTGAGFWHWTVYNIPPTTTSLPQGAGNAPAGLPAPAYGGATDFLDTGATGVNGNYGGPCPPMADKPHRYIFTLYALAVDDLAKAGGIPKTGTASLYSFVLNKGLGDAMIEKASFTATYGR
ncbi:MAG: kinase inhibitor [Rhodoferax ferrireducens]|uniref:Kinase inhibitor n=2 Tax=Pseudomonadota TaxID=1224 RepID=A0A1Y1QZH3_9GAMM|nr:MAG: kinase inhibitor [Rhodoferax ferrireducens]OQX17250.1 MAG: kinase inhibitor [Thiothrix lacustris]